MKLRIKGNSLRLRLLQKELAALDADGEISETMSLGLAPEEGLVYTLRASESADSLQAQFTNNQITVHIPARVVGELVSTERVGIDSTQEVAGGKTLFLLVEKDFKCLSPRQEDADAFPHPEQACGH